MSESSEPTRIVYHAKNRTFARLFNERSLEQIKDVVRRKLGLERDTYVSLKQMGLGALLDLDDDDDFQAFRVFARTSISVDIQVIVGASEDTPAPPSAPVDPPPVVATVTTTPEPRSKKRKVSFGDAEPGESRVQKMAITPDVTAEPVASKPAVPDEPPKKRHKKESAKAKDVPATQTLEAVDASKPKPKKSAVLDRVSEVDANASKDAEITPAKRQKKKKKDDSAGTSAPVEQDAQPIDQTDKPVNEASLELVPEKPKRKSAESSRSKPRKGEKTIGVCATIPQTSESTTIQSEVAAAILSDLLLKTSEVAPPPEPPAKRKPVRKVSKKASAPISALPAEPMAVLDASVNETVNASPNRRLEHEAQANEPPQRIPELNDPSCPICLEVPFHIRYCCPIVLKGSNAIQQRLDVLEGINDSGQLSLIKELEGLLRDSKATPKLSSDVSQAEDVQLRAVSPPPIPSLPMTPNIPSNSYVSEVTVESRDEGSSSESSDGLSDEGVEPQLHDEQPLATNEEDLEAVIRGPTPKRQSVLRLIDSIVEDENEQDKDKDSDEEEDRAELEEECEEGLDRLRRRLSRQSKRSSDSGSDSGSEDEDEDEESKSPSPSRSAKDKSDGTAQVPNRPVEGSAEHRESDAAMGNLVYPPSPKGQDDDSSEETHVGSEDRMVVDNESTENKDATSSTPGNKPQEPNVAAPNRDSSVPDVGEADPIEPADDLVAPSSSRSPNIDPIEVPSEDIESLFTGLTQSTPKPGVTNRIKTRDGQVPNDEDKPILLEQLALGTTDSVTPLPTGGRTRRKTRELTTNQEWKNVRFSPLPPATSTPAAVALLNHRAKTGTRSAKAAKTPAKGSEERPDALQSGKRIAPTPSLVSWETLADPSSPLTQLDETSVHIDELMNSPHPEGKAVRGRSSNKGKGDRLRKSAPFSQPQSSKAKERLTDLSSSQVPFANSQPNPTSSAIPNGSERREMSESEEEVKMTKKNAKRASLYRPLSQLASQATLFSPSLHTPARKSVTDTKSKKRVAEDSPSPSSSSSSDGEEAKGSGHIPRGRRAGSVLETQKRKKSLLSRI